ncbi:MAG: S41 family peptidase [Pseudomonadota bacterium]
MKKIKICACISLLLGFALTGNNVFAAKTKTPPKEDISLRQSAVFYASVAKHVLDTYVEPTDNNELLEGALNGMLSALDPHSGYLNPDKYAQLKGQTEGKFGGLGIEVTMKDGLVEIISPLDDTPADKAGLLPGDLIIRIEKQPVFGLSLIQAVDLLKGDVGTSVELTIRRTSRPDFTVNIKRAIIQIDPVKPRIEKNIGYIRIVTFNEVTTKEVLAAIEEFKDKLGPKLEGIVLDVRNNAGGLLDQAVSVSNLFLDNKPVVTIKARQKGRTHTIQSRPGEMARGIPVAVLINAGSASASEIVAGALQDHRRGIVLGTSSFGKGSVQSVIPLVNGGALKLTTALYFTPKGRSIQKSGIKPDITIKQAVDVKLLDESARIRESDFGRAVTPMDVNGKKIKKPAKNGDSAEASKLDSQTVDKSKRKKPVDYQLLRTIDVLRGIRFYQRTG